MDKDINIQKNTAIIKQTANVDNRLLRRTFVFVPFFLIIFNSVVFKMVQQITKKEATSKVYLLRNTTSSIGEKLFSSIIWFSTSLELTPK